MESSSETLLSVTPMETDPNCGIDIEPYKGKSVKNVQILDSQITYNKNCGISVNTLGGKAGTISNVLIEGNTIKNNNYGYHVDPASTVTGVVIRNNIGQGKIQDKKPDQYQ